MLVGFKHIWRWAGIGSLPVDATRSSIPGLSRSNLILRLRHMQAFFFLVCRLSLVLNVGY